MLKIQELSVGGVTYRLREPRLRDHINAQAREGGQEQYVIHMLGGMLIDENGTELGPEAILDLPLTAFNALSQAMEGFAAPPLPVPTAPSSD